MKKTALAICVLLGSSCMATAADVAGPVAYDWSGFYGGVHAGYLWGDVDLTEDVALPGGSIDGFVAGPLAGFNMQFNNLVFGTEGDFGWSEVDGHGTLIAPDFNYDLNWNAHIRARAGCAVDSLLFFAAGGLALADLDITEIGGVATTGTTYTGFTVGGGVDYGFSDNLVGRLEYLHDEFGNESYTEGGDNYTADLSDDIVRAVLVYRIGN